MRSNLSELGAAHLRVVVVDDNEDMRELLRRLLQTINIRHVIEFHDGQEALAKLAEVAPDFILTDLSMEPMNGLEFTRAVRQLSDESLCTVPIIMITGFTERKHVEGARDAGVNEMLAKPVTASRLRQRVEEIIHRPRPFVRSANYIGPCRRRHSLPGYKGPWRRKGDSDHGEIVAIEDISPQGFRGARPAR